MRSLCLIVLLLTAAWPGLAQESNAETFKSPSGQHTVQFNQIEHFRKAVPEGLDDVERIKYKVIFTRHDGSIVEAEYHDVLGWNERFAKPRF